ncbi:MAG: hypothetical protein U1A78_16685 [Polyangia bacterium]
MREQGMQAKRTSVNLDPQVVAEAKMALWEAQRAGIPDCPKNLTALYAVALARETEELRKRAAKTAARRGGPAH